MLAPALPWPTFKNVVQDKERWQQLLNEACRLRGRIYLADGAIESTDLDPNGALVLPLDHRSWHLLAVRADGAVKAALRLTMAPLSDRERAGRLVHVEESLGRTGMPLAYRLAAEKFLSEAELTWGKQRPDWFTTSGWAADPSAGASGVMLALATWAWTRLSSCACSLAVATERHGAIRQLVKCGASPLFPKDQPPLYFDAAYGCHVGLVGGRVYREADSFSPKVERLAATLSESEVVVGQAGP